VAAEVTRNPHNQTLNVVVQWRLLGAVVLCGMRLSHLLLIRGEGLVAWIGLVVVVQNLVSSLFNSRLFDFHEGSIYVLGVGIAGGMSLGGGGAEAALKSCSEALSERAGPAAMERHAM
jgi:O-antigen ligase